jgi:voltage-gated sodium channel
MRAAAARARTIVASPWFTRTVITTIVINCVLLAIETNQAHAQRFAAPLAIAHGVMLVAFGAELALRFASHGSAWREFLRDNWARFDLAVFVVSLIPAIGPLASVARLARVLRVARIVSVSPKLRLIIATMARSLPSLGHVGLLLGLLLFIYGVLGTHLFRATDATHWGDLGTSMLTLFQILTLEGWVELQRASMATQPWAWVFYSSFVLIAVFVVVNLFIAVVLSNLEQARRELAEETPEPSIADLLAEMRNLRALIEARPPPGPQEAASISCERSLQSL